MKKDILSALRKCIMSERSGIIGPTRHVVTAGAPSHPWPRACKIGKGKMPADPTGTP